MIELLALLLDYDPLKVCDPDVLRLYLLQVFNLLFEILKVFERVNLNICQVVILVNANSENLGILNIAAKI